MDFNALQHKLFALDPSDPAEDMRKLAESAGSEAQKNAAPDVNYVQESVEVQEGTMPVEGDYSLNDFAALAGVTLNESQKTGSAGQLKGKDAIKKQPAGTTKNPTRDKLVGEDEKPMSGWDAFDRGRKNSNNLGAIGLGADDIMKKIRGDGTKGDSKSNSDTSKPKQSSAPRASKSQWQQFLKKHTVALQQIAADPKKTQRFETWLDKWNEDIEEENKGLYHNVNKRKKAGTSRSKDHPKAPTDKAWKDAAKTAKTESVESIKEMLYRKLNSKK